MCLYGCAVCVYAVYGPEHAHAVEDGGLLVGVGRVEALDVPQNREAQEELAEAGLAHRVAHGAAARGAVVDGADERLL